MKNSDFEACAPDERRRPLYRTPLSVSVAITGRCNLRCGYCSHFSGPADDVDLPFDEWKRFFGTLESHGVLEVCLQGGEPFLRPDLCEIVAEIVRRKMRFVILTNGTLVTRKLAEFIAGTGRCNLIQVSIDGADDTTHGSFRGPGTFADATRGLEFLRERNLPLTVRLTLHRRNYRVIARTVAFLLDDMRIPRISVHSAAHFGLCRSAADDAQLTVEERSHAMRDLVAAVSRYPGRITASAGPLAEAFAWARMERGAPSHEKDRGRLRGCNGVFSKLAVRADGMLIPCTQLPDLALGYMNDHDLGELWLNHPTLRLLRERRDISLTEFAECRSCAYHEVCTGNCPASAYTMAGDVNHPSPESCYRRFKAEGGRLPLDLLEECGVCTTQ